MVALKILHPDADPERKRRLLLEAKAASSLNDARIVVLHDIGNADGVDFLVMEYVRGETLDKVIARGRLETKQAVDFGMAMAGALARAHEAGIIHRDLKPGNIMVTGEGAVKVLDSGLAKFKLTEAAHAATAGGTDSRLASSGAVILGTVAYMSSGAGAGAVTGHVKTYKSEHLAAVAFGVGHTMSEAGDQTGHSSGCRARRSHIARGSMLTAAAN